MILYEDGCNAAGLDAKEVAALARRIERAAKDAQRLGVTVFGGAHSADLRIRLDSDDMLAGPVILASMEGSWDGGDGGASEGPDGLLRGEPAR